MCGINGIFAYRAPAIDRDELIRTRDHMRPRGPDGSGIWVSADATVGLAHRRLAIIDLSSAGAQPMPSPDGRYRLTFNGEIYNYRDLRRELESQGVFFNSHSDSEVILALYAREGAAMLPKLRGMFAFAIWDTQKSELFAARDPMGIKPLYYSDNGHIFRFASQVKALAAGGAVSTYIEPAAMTGFYLWGSVPEPWTIFKDVFALQAGHSIMVTADGPTEPKCYYSVASVYAAAEHRSAPSHAEIVEALTQSVKEHLIADVPVGCFLSAGVDSGALLGLMRDGGARDIQTVTLGFEEYAGGHDDESTLAAKVARQYSMPHRVRTVTEAEFQNDLPRILDAMDQPSVDGVNSWFVSKAAKEMGLKVAVSGLGGDELFGGYPSFRDIPRWNRYFGMTNFAGPTGSIMRHIVNRIGTERLGLSPKAAGMLEYGGTTEGAYLLRRGLFMPWELKGLLDRDTLRTGLDRLGPGFGVLRALDPAPAGNFAKIATLESSLYMRNQLLRDTDWASMAHSLEVRVPLVDARLLATIAPAMTTHGARLGKAYLANSPATPLPECIVNRAKTGFTTPVGRWINKILASSGSASSGHPRNEPWARTWARYVAASHSIGS